MHACYLLGAALALAAPPADEGAADLAAPVKLTAGGKPINVEVGHAAPLFADLDGRGVKDLLVGQFGGGKLRVYRNGGTDKEPRFDKFDWFLDGKAEGTVPAS
jgi:hypothetical protein